MDSNRHSKILLPTGLICSLSPNHLLCFHNCHLSSSPGRCFSLLKSSMVVEGHHDPNDDCQDDDCRDPNDDCDQGGRPLRPSLPAWLRSLWDLPTLPIGQASSVSSFSSPLSFSSSFAGSKVGRCISKICTSTTAKGSYPCQLFRSTTQGV